MADWTLRPARVDDAEFLYRVYASTRLEELAVTGWSAAQTETFLRMQFAAQDRHYREHSPAARFDVIRVDGIDAGRLYVDRSPGDIRVLDVALLPHFQRRGVGRALLRTLLAEAGSARCRVSLHVERNNPALGLYEALGFAPVEEVGVYRLMHWQVAVDAPSVGAARSRADPVAA